jgi:HK97 gp10 family phage protein
MDIDIKVETKSVEGLEKAFTQLPINLTKKIIRKALRNGGKIVQKAAKANAPVKSGALKKAIKIRAGKRVTGKQSVFIGTSDKAFVGKMFYAAFIEFGHKQGSRKLGNERKDIAANPFMENAYETTKTQTEQTIINELWDGIEKEWSKA